jgi:hypothetical protein
MFDREAFIKCVVQSLKDAGYGPKKSAEIVDMYKYKASVYEDAGKQPADAALLALADTSDEMAFRVKDRAIAQRKNLAVAVYARERVRQALDPNMKAGQLVLDGKPFGGDGVKLARAAMSLIVMDPRFKGGNLESMHRVKYGEYWALMAEHYENFSKGFYGRQRGAANFDDVVDELFGKDTKNPVAKGIAASYKKLQDYMLEDFRAAGGALRKLQDFNLPQKQSAVKMRKASREQWVKDTEAWLDWSRMRYPDGEKIPPNKRKEVLEFAYETLTTDGRNKLPVTAMQGRGRALGNMMDAHRFLVYKDGEAWRAMHAKYGEGNVFDVIEHHIQQMSRLTSMVQMFGRNPDLMRQTVKLIVRQEADKLPGRAGSEADALMRRFDLVMDEYLHANAADPDSRLAAATHATANILNGALLGGSLFLNMASDTVNTMAIGLSNGQRVHRIIGDYLKYAMPGNYDEAKRWSAAAGYISDEVSAATYAAERWTGIAQYGPAWSRAMGDMMIRTIGLGRHTGVARIAPTREWMTSMWLDRAKAFDDLPYKQVMERYGIDAAQWDAVRKQVMPWEPRPGVQMLRPLDIRDIKHAEARSIFHRFAQMIDTETRYMVPGSTLEARTYLRDYTQPTTLPGALMYSAAMFKNFPITYIQQMGRMAYSKQGASRVKFVAGLGVGLLGVGALATQMSEITNGREPLPMDTVGFWGKAILRSGGLGIWGNYIFEGVNDYQNHAAVAAAGPIASFVWDTGDLALGWAFDYGTALERGTEYHSQSKRVIDYMKRYTPGSGFWQTKLILEREIWDRLEEWADPAGASRRQRMRVRRQERDWGNEYYLPPGERVFQ